jgi:hypothetical protein
MWVSAPGSEAVAATPRLTDDARPARLDRLSAALEVLT